MSVRTIRWEPIDPNEVDVVSFDFGLYANGAEITGQLVEVELDRGVDAGKDDMKVGMPTVVGHEVLQRVQGRVDGVIYHLRCRAEFADGRAHVLAGTLPCERK